jgi:hypothetical protein
MHPDPIANALGRFGYVRRDQAASSQAVAVREEPTETAPAYPQVVMIQGHNAGESWVRDHAGQLLVGTGVAILGLAALAVVALVAVVVTIGMVSCVAALATAKAAIASGERASRGRR